MTRITNINLLVTSILTLMSCQPTKDSKTELKDTTSNKPANKIEISGPEKNASKPKDWKEFESIFSYKDNEVTQKLGVKVLKKDSIEFRLLNEDELCNTEYWGTAKNFYADMDPETDEDDTGDGYMADEFVLQDSFKIIKIRIADTRDKARILFTDKTNEETDCFPTPGLLLKKTKN